MNIVRVSMAMGVVLLLARPGWAQEAETRLVVEDGEMVIEVGPFDLPVPMEMAGHEHAGVFPPIGTVTLPNDGYLYGFDYEVVDPDGNLLPSNIVHHFNLIDPSHRELFLPISQRMMAVGSETGGQSMPKWLLGYPVSEGQDVVVSAMLHNPTGVEHLGATLRVRLKYVKTGRPWPFLRVYPYQMDVAFPAGDKGFDLPPGEFSRSYESSPAIAGRLMVMGSHLHELATSIVFEDVTEDKVIWEGLPVEEDGQLAGVTIGRLYRKFGVKIFPDHVYRVTVHYNNTTGDSIPEGGMGVVAGVFMPARGVEWPEVDVADPLYALDREHYMRVVRGIYDVISTGGGRLMEAEMEMEKADHVHNER